MYRPSPQNRGFDGVEILQVQMEDFNPAYLQKLKRHAFINGISLMGLSTHQDFVDPRSLRAAA